MERRNQLVAHASQLTFLNAIAAKDPKAGRALGLSLAFQFMALKTTIDCVSGSLHPQSGMQQAIN